MPRPPDEVVSAQPAALDRRELEEIVDDVGEALRVSSHKIAGLTAASAETVKSRLRYAYRRLRSALEDLE